MNILIVSATRNEVQPLFTGFRFRKISGHLFRADDDKKTMDVLITGPGMVATAYYVTRFVHNRYGMMINAGIAGSFRKKYSPGDVVHVTRDCFPELGAETRKGFIPYRKLGMAGSEKVINPCRIKSKILKNLPEVNGVTVNTVHGKAATIEKIVRRLKPAVETMEGAAFLYVCRQEKIPCAQIRAISNYVEPRDKRKWMMPLAIRNLNDILITLLNEL